MPPPNCEQNKSFVCLSYHILGYLGPNQICSALPFKATYCFPFPFPSCPLGFSHSDSFVRFKGIVSFCKPSGKHLICCLRKDVNEVLLHEIRPIPPIRRLHVGRSRGAGAEARGRHSRGGHAGAEAGGGSHAGGGHARAEPRGRAHARGGHPRAGHTHAWSQGLSIVPFASSDKASSKYEVDDLLWWFCRIEGTSGRWRPELFWKGNGYGCW